MSVYRGDNPSAVRSQEAIADALGKLMEERGFADVTVSELCARAGVSRQTFYKLFGSKEAVVLYLLEHAPAAGRPEDPDRPVPLEESCVRFARYVCSNYAELRMLVDNGLSDVLEAMMRDALAGCTQSLLGLPDEEREMAACYTSAGLTALARCYIARHEECDLAALARMAHKVMSGAVWDVR